MLVCQAGRSDVGDLVSVILLHVELGLGRLVAIDEMLPVLSKYRLRLPHPNRSCLVISFGGFHRNGELSSIKDIQYLG